MHKYEHPVINFYVATFQNVKFKRVKQFLHGPTAYTSVSPANSTIIDYRTQAKISASGRKVKCTLEEG